MGFEPADSDIHIISSNHWATNQTVLRIKNYFKKKGDFFPSLGKKMGFSVLFA